MEKRNCAYCKKPLKAIGTTRKNGKDNFKDWGKRKTHKKCYSDYKFEQEFRELAAKEPNKYIIVRNN